MAVTAQIAVSKLFQLRVLRFGSDKGKFGMVMGPNMGMMIIEMAATGEGGHFDSTL
jgi:hypothetical protein